MSAGENGIEEIILSCLDFDVTCMQCPDKPAEWAVWLETICDCTAGFGFICGCCMTDSLLATGSSECQLCGAGDPRPLRKLIERRERIK